ncbi:MAG: flagellar basal body protein [Vampirovibrionia bacterium]
MVSSISGINSQFYGINASVSGMNAARTIQHVSANNIANANTDEYLAARVELSEAATGGVQATITVSEEQPVAITNPDGSERVLSNVDLMQEIMNTKLGGIMFQANAAAYKIQEETLGTIIDTMG